MVCERLVIKGCVTNTCTYKCTHAHTLTMYIHVHVLIRDEKEGRKKQARSNKQTNNKAKQHSTLKTVTFPNKNELPRVGFKPMTLYIDRALYYIAELPRQLSTSPTCTESGTDLDTVHHPHAQSVGLTLTQYITHMHRVWD